METFETFQTVSDSHVYTVGDSYDEFVKKNRLVYDESSYNLFQELEEEYSRKLDEEFLIQQLPF